MTWQKKYLFCQKCHVTQKFGLFQTNHRFNQKFVEELGFISTYRTGFHPLDSLYSTYLQGPNFQSKCFDRKCCLGKRSLAIFSFSWNKSLDRKLCNILFNLGCCLFGKIINCINFGKSSTSDLSRHFLKRPETLLYDEMVMVTDKIGNNLGVRLSSYYYHQYHCCVFYVMLSFFPSSTGWQCDWKLFWPPESAIRGRTSGLGGDQKDILTFSRKKQPMLLIDWW